MAKDNSCGWPIVNEQSRDPGNTDFIKPPEVKIFGFFPIRTHNEICGENTKGKKKPQIIFQLHKTQVRPHSEKYGQ